eukprot:5538799-Amphidinium_carterae.1
MDAFADRLEEPESEQVTKVLSAWLRLDRAVLLWAHHQRVFHRAGVFLREFKQLRRQRLLAEGEPWMPESRR